MDQSDLLRGVSLALVLAVFVANRAGQNLHGFILERATNLSPNVEGLLAAMLARSDKLMGTAWGRSFACLTALGRSGWCEADDRKLMPHAAVILASEAPPMAWNGAILSPIHYILKLSGAFVSEQDMAVLQFLRQKIGDA